jgi:hypothetical protein
MSSSSNVNKTNRRVMPVPKPRESQGQMHQHEQHQQKQPNKSSDAESYGTGNYDESSFEAPQTNVPVRGIGLDVLGQVPTGVNSYLISEWETTAAKVGASIRIIAKLNCGIDGVARVQVFHQSNNQEIWVESVNGFINKGVVTANWIAKANVKDFDKGDYFFTILGGRANAQSTNRLKLTGK